jgi:UDP-2,3-diacylglucosamine pyrophosphatase LpxH
VRKLDPQNFTRPPRRQRAAFFSDIHLGAPYCQAAALREALGEIDVDTLYLLGDVFDLERMRRKRLHWQGDEARVLERLRELKRQGTRIVFIPGNHDIEFRHAVGSHLSFMEVRRRLIVTLASGRRTLLTHGDDFDRHLKPRDALIELGDHLYEPMLHMNAWVSRARRQRGLPYWSFAAWFKSLSRKAETYMAEFESVAATIAKAHGCEGVICGHIHRPALKLIDGVLYANDGDWVESLSYLTESADGELQLRFVGRDVQPAVARGLAIAE